MAADMVKRVLPTPATDLPVGVVGQMGVGPHRPDLPIQIPLHLTHPPITRLPQVPRLP
jgi:hypothetical protein